jgi:hypothetical protein
MELREATLITITFGPFVSQTDGFTPKTALTPTIRLSKMGGAAVARNSGTATSHMENGYYSVTLDSTDTNTRGRLRVMATDTANHLPVFMDFDVLAAAYWDEKYAAALALQGGSSLTATLDPAASAIDAYYAGLFIALTGGTGAGQVRRILGYTGATKVAQVDTPWLTNPVAGTTYRLVANASAVLSAAGESSIANTLMVGATASVETGVTLKAALQLILSASAGVISGASAGAGTVHVKNVVGSGGTKDRIIAVNDALGNRTSVTYDMT